MSTDTESKELPWSERVIMLQIHPEAARISDIRRMAEDLSEVQLATIEAAKEVAREWYGERLTYVAPEAMIDELCRRLDALLGDEK